MSKFQILVLLGIDAPGLIAGIGFLWKRQYREAAAMGILLVIAAIALMQGHISN